MSECPAKNWLLSTAILFAFLWGYDYVIHGHMLMDMYLANAKVWRPLADIQALGGWCLAGTAAAAFVFSSIYACWSSKCKDGACMKSSANFGLWVGLLIGIIQAKSYVWLPIPGKLAVLWLIVETAKWGLAGIVLAKISSWNK